MDALMRTMIKTQAVVRTGVSVSDRDVDITMLLRHKKSSAQALSSFVAAIQNENISLSKWAQQEPNPALRDIIGKHLDLMVVYCESFRELVEELMSQRSCFKTIHSLEQQLEQALRRLQLHQGRESKAKKLILAHKKRGDNSKVVILETELIPIVKAVEQSNIEYAQCYYEIEAKKALLVQQALTMGAQASEKMATRIQVVSRAQQQLAQLIPEEQPHLTKKLVYSGSVQASENIVLNAVSSLQLEHLFKQPNAMTTTQATTTTTTNAATTANTTTTTLNKPQQPVFVPRKIDEGEGNETDAFDVIDTFGNIVPPGFRALRPVSGVAAVGEPLFGCKSLRSLTPFDAPPTPPPRPGIADLPTVIQRDTWFEAPGYVIPNQPSVRHRRHEEYSV